MSTFHAIELDRVSRKPSGRRLVLEAPSRDAAIATLLEQIEASADTARIDPTRTMVDLGTALWTLVSISSASISESSNLRRAAAKHRHVR